MGLKSKLAALAVAGIAAGTANAVVLTPTASGAGGEMVLSVWDPDLQISYSRDLGITLDRFYANQNTGFTFTADALWNTFLNLISPSGGLPNLANLRWHVFASDAVGTTACSPQTGTGGNCSRLLTTVNGAFSLGPPNFRNAQLQQIGGAPFHAAVNSVDVEISTHLTEENGSNIARFAVTLERNAYAGTFAPTLGLANIPFLTFSTLGQSMSFWSLTTGAPGTALANPATYQFNVGGVPSLMTLGFDGTLVYAPVPEPSTYALMLAGLFAVGAIARRRMK